MRIIDLENAVTCPACGDVWRVIVIQTHIDGRQYNSCPTCKRPYFMAGGGCRFTSPDGHKVFIPEATHAATA